MLGRRRVVRRCGELALPWRGEEEAEEEVEEIVVVVEEEEEEEGVTTKGRAATPDG